MAIARDSSAMGGFVGTGTTTSFAFTNTAGNFLVCFMGRTGGGAGGHNGATYNSVAMTYVGTATRSDGVEWFDIYVLSSPAIGANTLAGSGTVSGAMTLAAVSYSGAGTTGQPDASNFATVVAGTSASSAISVVASNCWVVALGENDNTLGVVVGSGVLAATPIVTEANFGFSILDSNSVVGTGSQTYGFTSAISGDLGLCGISISPPTGVVAAHNLTLIGAGT